MKKLINKNWYFRYGKETDDLNSIGEDFYPIGLPHTFDLPYYGESGFYVGYGVYKKELVFSESDFKSHIFLEFLGVFQECEIYINSALAKKHRGGYTGFVVDITKFASAGKNILTVRVNNLWQSDLPPRAGEHLFCGGIYRDVSVMLLPKAHIAWNGIFVKSEMNYDNTAEITVTVETENADGENISFDVYNAENECIFKNECIAKSVTEISFNIPNPILWDIDNPYLYTLKCCISSQEEIVKFGIRTIEFSAENGFFLNGKHLYIEGVNVHQDRGGWGDAVTAEDIRRDLKLMKEAGFNFIRTSHYPRHPFFARECDRLGLLVWYEAPFWGIGGFKEEGYWNASAYPTNEKDFEPFKENCLYALGEMIRQNRNSPSIIAWSMGNEVFFSKQSVMGNVKKLLNEMIDYAHSLDDTRPAGVGGTQRGDLHLIGDITGFNGDGAVLFKHPKIPNLVSEYGSVVSSGPGEYKLNYTAGAEEQLPWRCGRALWCGFHHGSIADIGNMGIVDLFRVPLKSYYRYRKELTGVEPPIFPKKGKPHHLKIEADKYEIKTDGTDDVRFTVTLRDKNDCVVDRDEEVTLKITSGNGLFPTGKEWIMKKDNSTFLCGVGAVEMRSYHSGEITVTASSESVLPDEIKIIAVNDGEEEGKTVRYPQCPAKTYLNTDSNIDLIRFRPVWASSSRNGHEGSMANDGNSETYWQPDVSDISPYLIFDMENFYTPRLLKLSLNSSRVKIKVSVSKDKKAWQTVYHNRFIKKSFGKKKMKLKKSEGRYMRVDFTSPDIKVTEIKVFGRK